MGREEPGDFHSIINEWGGAWGFWSGEDDVGHPWATYI
jgi:hypothetical protein